MPTLTAGHLLTIIALFLAVISFVPPLPNWLLGVAVVILCVGVLVLGVPLRGG